MNRRSLLAIAASTMASAATPNSLRTDLALMKAEAWMDLVDCSFAVAYFLGPLDDRDKRPALSGDPFAKKSGEEEIPSLHILRSEKTGEIDTAALVASVMHRVRVPQEKLASLAVALLNSDIEAPVAECYEPHHVVIGYNKIGVPCAVIEICFSCIAFRIFPGGRTVRSDYYDIAQAARILVDLGLPLNGAKLSIEDYTSNIQKRIESHKAKGQ